MLIAAVSWLCLFYDFDMASYLMTCIALTLESRALQGSMRGFKQDPAKQGILDLYVQSLLRKKAWRRLIVTFLSLTNSVLIFSLALFQSKTFCVRNSTPVSWPPRVPTAAPHWALHPTCAPSSTSTSISTSISTNTPTSILTSTPSRPSPTPSCPPQHRPWCVPLPEMWG